MLYPLCRLRCIDSLVDVFAVLGWCACAEEIGITVGYIALAIDPEYNRCYTYHRQAL